MKKERCINILNSVYVDTINKRNLEVNCHIGTIIDYLFSKDFVDILCKSRSFKSIIAEFRFPFESDGWYNEYNNYIYLLVYNDEKKNKISNLVISLLHELRHSYQVKYFEKFSDYEKEIFLMEDYLRAYDNAFYFKHHSSFLKEIDADLFALDYARDYVNTNKSYVNEKYFEFYKQNVLDHLYLFDEEIIINRFIRVSEKNRLNSLIRENDSKPIIMNLLFNEYGFLKSFEDIYWESKNGLNPDMFEAVISCRSVLNMMDVDSLSDDMKRDISRIVNNAIMACFERRKYIIKENIKEDYNQEYCKEENKCIFYKKILNNLNISKVKKI